MSDGGGKRRVARRIGGGLAVVVLGMAAVAAGAAVLGRPRTASQAATVGTGTAAVTRGTVNERVRFSGVLGYEGTYPLAHQGRPGIVTSAAEPGTVVGRGAVLFAVANEPVRLLVGAVPAYRDLAAGVPDGPDVRQLEENLVALGMDPGKDITVDERFSAATGAAIRRWQAAWGWPAIRRTGALPLGSVLFQPAPVRVAQVQATVGTTVGPGAPVLTATSTNRVVTAEVPTARQVQVRVGDQVVVTVAGLAPLPGKVIRVGRVVTSPSEQESGRQGQSGQTQPPTITVTVTVTLPDGSADLDRAPAGVAITTASHQNVLLVPVVALLARPGGGYQVRLAEGGFVEVKPGLFDEVAGTVEVTGELTVGQLVQVPAS